VHGTYSASEIDLFAVYCSERDRCFLLPISRFDGAGIAHLRLTPARNGQVACTNLADDFDFVGAIAQLGERLTGSQEVAGSSPASSTPDPPIAVGSNPFRDRLGYWMERAAGGEEILVTFRGKPRILLAPAKACSTRRELATLAVPQVGGGGRVEG
jgi:PD-(D/E)XK endonuclease